VCNLAQLVTAFDRLTSPTMGGWFTQVWMPPPTDSVSDEGYMPRDLYNLNSKYGSAEELKQAIRVRRLSP
jgi:hypothetical protein